MLLHDDLFKEDSKTLAPDDDRVRGMTSPRIGMPGWRVGAVAGLTL